MIGVPGRAGLAVVRISRVGRGAGLVSCLSGADAGGPRGLAHRRNHHPTTPSRSSTTAPLSDLVGGVAAHDVDDSSDSITLPDTMFDDF